MKRVKLSTDTQLNQPAKIWKPPGLTRHQRQEVSNKICTDFCLNSKAHTSCDNCQGRLFPCRKCESECIQKTENTIRNALTSIRTYGCISNNSLNKESWFLSRKIYYVAELSRWDEKEICDSNICETCELNIRNEVYECVEKQVKNIIRTYRFKLERKNTVIRHDNISDEDRFKLERKNTVIRHDIISDDDRFRLDRKYPAIRYDNISDGEIKD